MRGRLAGLVAAVALVVGLAGCAPTTTTACKAAGGTWVSHYTPGYTIGKTKVYGRWEHVCKGYRR